jgi:hypothetical protein
MLRLRISIELGPGKKARAMAAINRAVRVAESNMG